MTSITISSLIGRSRGASGIRGSLRRRYVFTTGAAAIVLLAIVATAGSIGLNRSMTQQQNAILPDGARRSAFLVDRVLAGRLRKAALIAGKPSVTSAPRKETAASRPHSLPLQTI